jgi:hypothetical protein
MAQARRSAVETEPIRKKSNERKRKAGVTMRTARDPRRRHFTCAIALVAASVAAQPALAERSAGELASELSNPISRLVVVPFQFNYDQKLGPDDDGERWYLNFQPVVPVDLGDDWNLLMRTVLPVVAQEDVAPGAGSQFGLGDLEQRLYFSPKEPTSGGWIWGAGPVFLLPTGTDERLTAGKWGVGPTAVVLKLDGPWTYGALGNHVWSFAGDDDRSDVSDTFVQPFLAYRTPAAWTLTLNTESTYDWEREQWSVPINVVATKILKIDGHALSVGGGFRYWAESPEDGAEGLGYRFVFTLLFPK